ncbi:MAG: aminopeptidase P family protein [Anaerolineales bacterium]|nr:aminopeptidase P family protein [Anaerolineales bacterium]
MNRQLQIPEQEYRVRLERVQAALGECGLDGLVAFAHYQEREGYVSYLTSHSIAFPNAMSQFGPGYSAYVLPASGEGILVAPCGYNKDSVVNARSVLTGGSLTQKTIEAIKECSDGTSDWGVVGMDILPAQGYLQLAQAFSSIEWQDAGGILDEQRLIKSEAEINLLENAARIAGQGIQAGLDVAAPGVVQAGVEMAARQACLLAGADVVLRIRVSSGGKNLSSNPRLVLDKGDFVHLEVAGRAAGYAFDLSRVKVVGQPTAEQIDYMDHLAEAVEWMTETMQPQKRITYYYTESRGRSILAQAHGIGLEIAENPRVGIHQPLAVQPDMVLCVAPAINCQVFGSMAIKEMIEIRETGAQTVGNIPLRMQAW